MRVGCGRYDWLFRRSSPCLAERLTITVDVMESIAPSCLEPLISWLSPLSYPWCTPTGSTSGCANSCGTATNPEVPHGTLDLAQPVNDYTGTIMNWIVAKMKGVKRPLRSLKSPSIRTGTHSRYSHNKSAGECMPKGYWIVRVDIAESGKVQGLHRSQCRAIQEVRCPLPRARRPLRVGGNQSYA